MAGTLEGTISGWAIHPTFTEPLRVTDEHARLSVASGGADTGITGAVGRRSRLLVCAVGFSNLRGVAYRPGPRQDR